MKTNEDEQKNPASKRNNADGSIYLKWKSSIPDLLLDARIMVASGVGITGGRPQGDFWWASEALGLDVGAGCTSGFTLWKFINI